ncbi:hypothetical protein GPECTOR_20g459 [Gonium pectorale]|uniref:Uncharacterized protein n=1 Tax=Gonium pectorale TaxID=33097 RepID=A0A150GIG3_GONPE|nr:hypothetical protein GPECTOR_20g459 [Gonium pectorale]|eukprot:KXZ49603.1 hypothetical protein GPECTOR_20g459 [Gonium pectorale]
MPLSNDVAVVQPILAARVFLQLPPELTELIVRRLYPNEAATSFRLVNKAAAAQFLRPEHTTVRLSQPVPPHAFAAHWLAPGATRGLTLERRKQLLILTAASGVVANLEVAAQAAGLELSQAACDILPVIAAAGNLDSCQWLLGRLRHLSSGVLEASLEAAARQGHRRICELLLGVSLAPGKGPRSLAMAAQGAVRSGHLQLADWLLQRVGAPDLSRLRHPSFAVAMAEGCDLAALQRRVDSGGWGQELSAVPSYKEGAPAAAAGSPTPDWAAKVEWLEAQGCPRSADATDRAAALPDDAEALAHLTWLRGRGCPLGVLAVQAAAKAGNVAALQYLLAEVPLEAQPLEDALFVLGAAAAGGHLAVLQGPARRRLEARRPQ